MAKRKGAKAQRRKDFWDRIDPDEPLPIKLALPFLPKALAPQLSARLQAALNEVGSSIDALRPIASDPLHGHHRLAQIWLFELDEVQTQLCELTLRANASRRQR